ncbi:hypothetical protein G9A89_008490 [Geosiphon pyriformis]|nr:hypothetical protein G9A89_008490 [Geosiphon pyriformis]
MSGPLSEHELDSLRCSYAREDSETIRFRNKTVLEATAQFKGELLLAQQSAQEEARIFLLDLQRQRQEKWDRVQREYDLHQAKMEEERRRRKAEFDNKQAWWQREYEKLRRHLLEQKEAEAQRQARLAAEQEAIKAAEEKRRKESEAEERNKREAEAQRQARLAAEQEAIKAAEEKRRKESEVKALQIAQVSKLAGQKAVIKDIACQEVLEKEKSFKDKLKFIRDNVSENQQLRTLSSEYRKIVRLRFNQLTNTRTTIINTATELSNLCNAARTNQQLYYHLLNEIAENLVTQAEVEASLTPTDHIAAFQLAHVCVLIAMQHVEFLDNFVMTHITTKCCYVLPRYHIRTQGQSLDEYKEILGYKKEEKEDKYFSRMQAILALYAAILQTSPLISGLTNPYGMEHGWKWLARIMNMKPQTITPYLIYTFLQVAGPRFIETYPEQGRKLINTYYNAYVGIGHQEFEVLRKESAAAMSRLESFLSNTRKNRYMFPDSPGRFPN